MPRFIRKPIVITAHRVAPDKVMQQWVTKWCDGKTQDNMIWFRDPPGSQYSAIAHVGDWVIQYHDGTFGVMKHDKFCEMYDPDEILARYEMSSDYERMVYIDDNGHEQPLYPARETGTMKIVSHSPNMAAIKKSLP